MSWAWIVRGYGGSLRKIWGWGRYVQKWYQGCWMKDKTSGVCKCAKTFWSNSKLNQTCWKELLLVMSYGSLSTIHSPNGRALNGRAHCHQDAKRQGCSSSKPRWCWSFFFFDVHGTVHAEFLPQGQTINQHVYKNILRCLMRSVRENGRDELWETRSWLLHHDNAPAHNALGIREFLAKNNIAVLEQPPYCTRATTLLSRSGPLWLLFVSKLKSSKELVFKIQKPLKQRDERAPSDPRGILPDMHWRGDWKNAFEPKEITL